MWLFYLVSTIGIIFFIGMTAYCFIFIFNSDRKEMNKYKQSSFDRKLLEHCKVRSIPNDIENESEESKA